MTSLIKRGAAPVMVLTAASVLAGCSEKVPSGQVIAIADGMEVTRRDLAAEPDAMGSDKGSPELGTLLSGVIDRKLAAAEARRLNLDETPQFVSQASRVQEVMLSRALFDRWSSEMPQPQPAAIAQYIARNPQQFDQRKIFLVDGIEATDAPGVQQALAPLQTNDAVAAYMEAQHLAYKRERAVLDSANLPLPFYRKLLALPAQSPLAFVQGGKLNVLAVLQARDEPLAPADRTAAAIAGLKQAAVRDRLAKLRTSAQVAYQPGYRPAEKPGGATR